MALEIPLQEVLTHIHGIGSELSFFMQLVMLAPLKVRRFVGIDRTLKIKRKLYNNWSLAYLVTDTG